MRRHALVALVASPLLGAFAGRLAGPFLARVDDRVALAGRIWQEDSEGLAERTLASEAFRATGKPSAALFAEARGVVQSFRVGGAVFGLWCGLVIGLKLLWLAGVPRNTTYEVDQAHCVACGRCFEYCPREQLRLREQ